MIANAEEVPRPRKVLSFLLKGKLAEKLETHSQNSEGTKPSVSSWTPFCLLPSLCWANQGAHCGRKAALLACSEQLTSYRGHKETES